MRSDRRSFLKGVAGTTAALALGKPPRVWGTEAPDPSELGVEPAPQALRILILGGTGFIGPHQVRYALARGHSVTLFNRGSSPGLFPASVEELVGDRSHDLSALERREWDVVVDNSATLPRWVRDSARLLRDSVDRYLFVSTLSVYARNDEPGADETAELLGYTEGDPLDATEVTGGSYGALKAACEAEARSVFGSRALIIRPGLIVGPGDESDRFTYWPDRVHRGGEVLAPDRPGNPVQFIDVRDLTHWMIHLLEDQAGGTLNATGPDYELSFIQLLAGIRAITPAPVRLTWVDQGFLEERGVRPWIDLPLWMPPVGATAGFMRRSVRRAREAGLTYRPLAETARDTLEWWLEQSAVRRGALRVGMSLEAEQEVLAAWQRAGGGRLP